MSLVSIVIPTHNCAQYLGGAIRSALRQTHRQIEVIVVDDGSTDDTVKVVRAFGDAVRYLYQQNAGPSAARNLGLAHARGEYVAFLDADDEVRPEWVTMLRKSLRAAAFEARFAVSDAWLWDGVNCIDRYRVSEPPSGLRGMDRLLDDNRPYVAILAPRSVLQSVGGFRQGLWVNEDFDLWLRLLAGGYGYSFVAEPLYLYRVREESLSDDCRRRLDAACGLYREALATMPLSVGQRRRMGYLLWRERARVSWFDAQTARSKGKRIRWAMHVAESATAQAVRLLIRPHFTLQRAWRRASERGSMCQCALSVLTSRPGGNA
ncbi:MAG TPA: glycosyltransferase family 2 protein [Armatimonadetes bacterium]|jgi:glycosyltransferase involved in cell wall biosynthesis|nr:glycosyltransferase family 2 protein [Armatimonadota bacterium]